MATRHLDIGCGSIPRNPYRRDEAHGIDIALPPHADPRFFACANLSMAPIPHADASLDSVSAFDFLEHVPRILATPDGAGTRFPFVELMSEVHRVLKPGGRFYAVTPAWPRPEAFHDPTHVNVITIGTAHYFCGADPGARMYGFRGSFKLLRNDWGLHPEALSPDARPGLARRFKRWQRGLRGRLSHLVWEFERVLPGP